MKTEHPLQRDNGICFIQKTKQLNESAEMKVLRKIVGKLLREKIRTSAIREECEIEPINDKRLNWNDHIEWNTAD